MSINDKDREPSGVTGESVNSDTTDGNENQESSTTSGNNQKGLLRDLLKLPGARKGIAILGALVVALTAVNTVLDPLLNIGSLGSNVTAVFSRSSDEQAVEDAIRGHHKAIGARKFEDAYNYFGVVEKERKGDKEKWAKAQDEPCEVVSTEVKHVKVGSVEANKAVATTKVRYEYECGYEDWFFVRNLSKVNGEWKLDSLEDSKMERSSIPQSIQNGGQTESDVSGRTKQANLESVKASATAEEAYDAAGDLVYYEPGNVVDGKPDTSWQVAVDGKEPWVLLEYDKPIRVSRIGIIPGYDKKDPHDGRDRFYEQHVVRKARIEFSDESQVEADFERDPAMQFIEEVPNTETTSVRVTILDTYPPEEKSPSGESYDFIYDKVAISEIEVEQE